MSDFLKSSNNLIHGSSKDRISLSWIKRDDKLINREQALNLRRAEEEFQV